ncbi:carnitine dehydratase [beta proteobacterium AAP121]|nr:carnitine dehydratase [beta proteobacterium AAP65]KPG00614.1 carnitine dehydratase [beta proteobacterium AAP121]
MQAAGPLQGLRVIELAAIGPVPLAGMLLADLGAEVQRIDRPEASGLGLDLPPERDINARGRRSIALDLKQPAGRDAALRLIEGADVLLEGLRPGVTEKLGLGPADCHALNPGLVYGRMTGYGQTGPLAQTAGHDLNYIALTGVLHAIGPAGGKPVPPLNLVGDYGGGALYLAFGVMAALFERERSGLGQVVDAAMVDGAASLASIFWGLQGTGGWRAERGQNLLDGGAPFYDTYETADGRHISLAALEPKFFAQLAAALGLDDAFVRGQHDRRLWPDMRAAIAAAVKQRSRSEWCERLEGSDVCFAPVLSFEEAATHPHAQARGAFTTVGGLVQPAPAPRFSRTPAGPLRPPPAIGADGDALLQEAGFSETETAALRAAGVLR